MWKDHIVEDVRKVRKQQAAIFDFDLFAILEDARKNGYRSKALIFMISRNTWMLSNLGEKIRSGSIDGLHARFFIV